MALENWNIELEKTVPTTPCAKETKELDAWTDWNLQDSTKRKGDWHCFCKDKNEREGYNALTSYKFSQDGQTHCVEWFNEYYSILVLGFIIPGTVGSINILLEIVIAFGSEYFARPVNFNDTIEHSIRGISIM